MRNVLIILFIILHSTVFAQTNGKLSHYVSKAYHEYKQGKGMRKTAGTVTRDNRCITALVKCANATDITSKAGCRILASFDDIHVASIPLRMLPSLTADPSIIRIEANESCHLCVDTARAFSKADMLWNFDKSGNIIHDASIPRAYTAKGVVVGVQDVGFDLTHPNFYRNRGTGELIIKRFWDMLDTDTVGSVLPVGRDYVTETDLIAKAHATDGYKQTHGTMTAGIAAGSGYDTPHIGVAPDADLCIVANSIGADSSFIAPEDKYKYTMALDILGFKYIFDYADSVGKPCVINFSEGSHPDFYDNILYDEMLQKLQAPGHIIVVSAGNEALKLTHLDKPADTNEAHSLYRNSSGNFAFLTFRSDNRLNLRITIDALGDSPKDFIVNTDKLVIDSLYSDTIDVNGYPYNILYCVYPNCYDTLHVAGEIGILDIQRKSCGTSQRIALSLFEEDGDHAPSHQELFYYSGNFYDNGNYHSQATNTHNIFFPATSPYVITAGAYNIRDGFVNHNNEWIENSFGNFGLRSDYSSIGPSHCGITKPDIAAPGTFITSSYSTFFLEENKSSWDAAYFDYNGRTYGWRTDCGTSFSAPIVTGIIALWLEACPTLTRENIMETLRATADRTYGGSVDGDNEYGFGHIDALAGLNYIMEHFASDGIKEVTVAPEDNSHSVSFPYVYDLTGRRVSANNQSRGIYIKNGRKVID